MRNCFLPLVRRTTCINQEASFSKRGVTHRMKEKYYNMLIRIPNLISRLAEERQRNSKKMILTSSKENFSHCDLKALRRLIIIIIIIISFIYRG